MTTDEMRDAIEATFSAIVGRGYASEVPPGITPMNWWAGIPAAAEELSADDFASTYAANAGVKLAREGADYGCDAFARLSVEDRSAASVMNGSGRKRVRPREFIVHALGWKEGGSK